VGVVKFKPWPLCHTEITPVPIEKEAEWTVEPV